MTDPEQPVAGREVRFTLSNLQPWQRVDLSVHHRDSGTDDPPRVMYADAEGAVRWSRLDYADRTGDWTVGATTADDALAFHYRLAELDLGELESVTFGVPLRVYRGTQANIFFSDLVPAAFAVDLQDRLQLVRGVLEEQLGIRSVQTPDIYVAGNWEQLDRVLQTRGTHFGEYGPAGYFVHTDPRPGIYLRTDIGADFLPHALAHEYVHLVMKEYMEGGPTLVWISEGVAELYAFEAGLQTSPPYTLGLIKESADVVLKEALVDGLSLEAGIGPNPHAWGYMVVRYLSETIEKNAPIEVMTAYNDRNVSYEQGIEEALGIGYDQFEQDFIAWLKEWDDLRQAEVHPYLAVLQGILDSLANMGEVRRELFADMEADYDRNRAIEGYAPLIAESERLFNLLQAQSPPAGSGELHENALAYLELNLERIRLELKSHETGSSSAYAAAFAMIPELIARLTAFRQGVSKARFSDNLIN